MAVGDRHRLGGLRCLRVPIAALTLTILVGLLPALAVKAVSDPIPMKSVTFIVKKDGQVVAQRRTDIVLESMKLGFRTTNHANGTYEILFRGEMPFQGSVVTVESAPRTVTIRN